MYIISSYILLVFIDTISLTDLWKNVALGYHGATCTASSQSDASSGCGSAIDGKILPITEWASDQQGENSWIHLYLSQIYW